MTIAPDGSGPSASPAPTRADAKPCCCGGDERCGPPAGPTRRDVLAASAAAVVAGPFARGDAIAARIDPDHFVPEDKRLAPAWLRALTARGEPEEFRGDDLATIGMPVGGICAGQVYLTGDGRLVNWDVDNRHANSGYGSVNYQEGRRPTDRVERSDRLTAAAEVRQGFAVAVRRPGDATPEVRTLDRGGFDDVRFRGAWPIGGVRYADRTAPVAIELTAFSPFVPLEPDDSALPATLLQYTVRNASDAALEVTLGGWLENFVCRHSAAEALVGRVTLQQRCAGDAELAAVVAGARLVEPAAGAPLRPPIVFADFEGDDYGDWKVGGTAFGERPAAGTLPRQQPVAGFEGRGLVNTFLGGDPPTGRLESPPFTIERAFVSFLIGGGGHAGATCMNLVLDDGRVARSATGRDDERLARRTWDVRDLAGQRARLVIVDAASGPWGHVNVDQIEFRDDPPAGEVDDLRQLDDHGTTCLALLDAAGGERLWAAAVDADPARALAALRPVADGAAGEPSGATPQDRPTGAVGARLTLKPGEARTLTFAIAWNFPNLRNGGRLVGHRYAKRFRDALAVVRHLARDGARLTATTLLWHDTWYDSTLPYWLLDRLHSTVANLATNTCQWWRNDRFWAWEGVGCCSGTCGHVWNYAQAPARLFPSLERSVRELQDFAPGVGFDPTSGQIGFRGEGWRMWAADAQCGYVLKVWREHLCGSDDAFLARLWTRVRQALEFLVARDAEGQDAPDGLLEGRQHNTYDIDYFGVNPFSGWLYVAALRAGQAMAAEVGDTDSEARYRDLAEQGRQRLVERSFDPKLGYFVQRVDLAEHPDWQVGDGCLADQLFGQSWALQVGLAEVVPPREEAAALDAIWRFCWAPDVGPQNRAHAPERWFARPGEAGLFTCTWPRSAHLGPRSTRYRDEVWTGIEYQVASHLAWAGRVTEALAICRAVHERYHPAKRNPFNEVECGDHYARAMASWAVLLGLSGFDYHGPAGRLAFAPRLRPDDFRCAFTAAAGWGSFAQVRERGVQTARVELRHGRLRIAELGLELPEGAVLASAELRVGEQRVPARAVQDGRAVRIALDAAIELSPFAVLEVRLVTAA
ncbi:MAG: hypothetical protein IPM29_23820 [Planctomycetes bacterium]|nr:hypothetical protein [Planctomycetota bacterium]